MSLSYKVVIPARFASTRFPGKPLADICGKPMLQHVYECALKSAAQDVIIATDDKRIQLAAEKFGAEVCMTSADHLTGTDRLSEVSAKYDWQADDIVVNLQGDEPLTPVVLLDQVASDLADHAKAGIATLCSQINSYDELSDPNVVKVVQDAQGYALYFSRAVLPFNRDDNTLSKTPITNIYQRHLGMYAYRVGFLQSYANMEICEIEKSEKLEQLRALYNGVLIHVAQACTKPGPGIDTPDDLLAVSKLICS